MAVKLVAGDKKLKSEATLSMFDACLTDMFYDVARVYADKAFSSLKINLDKNESIYLDVAKEMLEQCKKQHIKDILSKEFEAALFIVATRHSGDWKMELLADAKVYLVSIPDDFDREIDGTLSSLTERTRFVLEERYKNRKTLKEIAEQLAVTPERVRQIEHRGLFEIRRCYRIVKSK